MPLSARWLRACAALALDGAPAPATALTDATAELLWHVLAALYSYPLRVYHTRAHVAACMPLLDEAGPRVQNAAEAEFALFLHDSVQMPEREDNEVQSAAVAALFLAQLGPAAERHAAAVTRLIHATRHDGTAFSGDLAIIADIDLAILGTPPEAYDAYAAAIRREYGHVDDARYRAGRGQFLRRLMQRPHIYHSAWGLARWEAAARENLRREITRLEG